MKRISFFLLLSAFMIIHFVAAGCQSSGGGGGAASSSTSSGGTTYSAPSGNGVISIWGGAREAIALKGDGTVWTWGYNASGQLGNGNTNNEAIPAQVAGLSDITTVMGAEHNNFALKSDGTVWAWGGNNLQSNDAFYLLGVGPSYDGDVMSTSPLQVAGLTSVTLLGSRAYHAVAVESNGTVWTWGWNQDDSLGVDSNEIPSTPVEVVGVSNPIQVTAGFNFSVALLQNHELVTWGSDLSEALGNETQFNNGTPINSYSPVAVDITTGLTDVTYVSAGWEHVLAVKSDGTVWSWGTNTWSGACGGGGSNVVIPAMGRLGIVDGSGDPVTDESLPTQIAGLTDVIQVSGGDGHSAVLKSDGTVWTFGANGCGQLGNGDANLAPQYTPVKVVGLTDVIWIAARDHHTQALKSDGTVWSWGSGEQGELGVPCNPLSVSTTPGPGDCTNSNVPVRTQI